MVKSLNKQKPKERMCLIMQTSSRKKLKWPETDEEMTEFVMSIALGPRWKEYHSMSNEEKMKESEQALQEMKKTSKELGI